jgi:hypothetical protein
MADDPIPTGRGNKELNRENIRKTRIKDQINRLLKGKMIWSNRIQEILY